MPDISPEQATHVAVVEVTFTLDKNQLTSVGTASVQTILPITVSPFAPWDIVGCAVAPGVRLTVPIITTSDTPAGPIKKVLFLVIVGFSVYVPAAIVIFTGLLSGIVAVAAKAADILAKGFITDPFPVTSDPFTLTQ